MHNRINFKINKMNDMNEQREREKYFAMLTFLEGIASSL